MATKLYPDVSHYHPVADWSKVKTYCPFLISKATQGTSYVDPTLEEFIAGCEEQKIPYWLYTYLNKGSELDQAKFLVQTCTSKIGNYFVGYVLDVEAENTAANVKSALDYLNGLGLKTMLYTMYAQYETYKSVITGRPADCAWWEARYGLNSGAYNEKYAPHSGADLHQYTSEGSCSGIKGSGIDLNRLTGTKTEDWFKTANAATTTETKTTSAASTATTTKTTTTVDNTKQIIKNGQTHANNFAGCGLTVDGVRGSATKKGGIKVLQTAINLDYKAGLKVDGVWGTKYEKALGTRYVKKGETQYMVTALEILLMLKGYDTGGLENPGVFGAKLEAAVKSYQKAAGLTVDGIAGAKTFKSLIS